MKTVLVTGAAQGLGLKAAETLARLDYRVVLVDLRPLEAQLAQLRGAGAQVVGLSGDVTSETFVQQIAALLLRDYGGLDALVNNAGVSLIAPAEHTTAAQWRHVIDVNLFGPFLLCKYLGAQMLQRRHGSIVNVASVAGLAGISNRSAYNASKHGLIGLTRTLAAEWGGRGVRVNAVCPGWVKTEMDLADQATAGYTDADITGRVPMGRFASPDDIARAIAFLADPEESSFINGHALVVDGGWTADGSWESLRLRHR